MKTVTHRFVEFIPDKLEEGVVYISVEYATANHRCCCGCGNEVVTPLSPTDWKVTYDGKTISLHPSIGNWGFNCQSHYWITNNTVQWASKWSKERIAIGRQYDRQRKADYYGGDGGAAQSSDDERRTERSPSLWSKLKRWLP